MAAPLAEDEQGRRPPGSAAGGAGPTPSDAGRILAIILLAGAALRLGLWYRFAGRGIHIWDEGDYHTLATSLLARGEFAFVTGEPTSLRPPLYPAFVAGIYSASGPGDFQAVRLAQAALSLLNVALLYRLGAAAFDRRVGLWLAGIYAFYPSMLGANYLVLTEVLFTFLLSATCLATIRALQSGSLARLALAGVLLGLAALTRSVMWPFPPVLAAYLLLAWRGGVGRRLLAAGTLLLASGITIAPWAVRNTRLEGTFLAIDCMGGRNLMMGNYPYTPLHRSWDAIALEGERSWHSVLAASEPSSLGATQGRRDKMAMRYAIGFMTRHPRLTLGRDVVKFFDFWGLERELVAAAARGYFGPMPGPAIVLLMLAVSGSYVAAMISGGFGMAMLPPADRRIHVLLLLVIAFVCALHTLSFGHSRYHLPLMPLVLAYSANAALHARDIWRRRGRPSFWLAVGLGGVLLAAWAWDAVVVDLDRFLGLLHPVT